MEECNCDCQEDDCQCWEVECEVLFDQDDEE